MQLTTRHLVEIRRRNEAGENDVIIANALGTSQPLINYHRRKMGLPAIRGRNTHREWVRYTVSDSNTGELLVSGTAKECAAKLGYVNEQSFRSAVRIVKKYDFAKERIS